MIFKIVACKLVLYVNVSDETMTQRLLERGKTSGRVDDNEETIKQRLNTVHHVTQPVIDYYEKQGKVRKEDADKTPNDVFMEIEKLIDSLEIDGTSKIKDKKIVFVVGGPGSGTRSV